MIHSTRRPKIKYQCNERHESVRQEIIQEEGKSLNLSDRTELIFVFRNNRAGISSSPLFKSNYRHGFYTLLKLTFIILSIASLILCLALCYNLYSRFKLLQETLDRGKTFAFLSQSNSYI